MYEVEIDYAKHLLSNIKSAFKRGKEFSESRDIGMMRSYCYDIEDWVLKINKIFDMVRSNLGIMDCARHDFEGIERKKYEHAYYMQRYQEIMRDVNKIGCILHDAEKKEEELRRLINVLEDSEEELGA